MGTVNALMKIKLLRAIAIAGYFIVSG